ncbi:putative receptor-like protein kinase At3g47110 [Cucumis sativus]|uniref:non-specific serine/threonine protein kinase n=1 Tax=Cucumis sativus TaxID=3659 RepID=A0A0A0L9X2_CUCSA|nr:putative receptor-like protein kinase At3g47110 [Cucumis sativus]KGN58770.1 hypothetical protein Csa_002646 [Cucumis sativus]
MTDNSILLIPVRKLRDWAFVFTADSEFLSCRMRQNYCFNTNRILRILLYHFFFISMSLAFAKTPISGIESDHLALLDLKSRVLNDPLKIMSSWNDSRHLCDWTGITCNSTIGRVMVLDLEAHKLSGSIPNSLGNMTHLIAIRLGDNRLHGHIPQEFGQLLQLRHLNLSYNNFSGEIPGNISHCTQLVHLELGNNGLEGQIPHQLFTLTKLKRLSFPNNNLIGTIPSWIGNFSSLLHLSVAYNNFQGNIPNELGHLRRLEFFAITANYLTGTVPLSLYNITSLTLMSLTANRLQGTLPPNIGYTLPNLQIFVGGGNNFTGSIPTSFANISGLRELDLPSNSFVGMLPNDLGSLKDLERLNFEDNILGTGRVGDLNFISSLANCTSLKVLGLSWNHFGGVLPSSIGNLSSQLTALTLGANMLSGSIPSAIANLINLQHLVVGQNYLNGSVPPNIGNLQNLVKLFLQGNNLTGPIPSSIGNLSSIVKLYMNDNRLEGSIPRSLGRCKTLQILNLSGNKLSGLIPNEVLHFSSFLAYLALNNNSLTGPLALEVDEVVSLITLDVSKNKLSGNISSNLGKCVSMRYLDLSGNQFEGTIPQSLETLKSLEVLNLSSNNLSGSIPQFLGQLHSLKYVNLSYNDFEGKVPTDGIFSNSTMISIIGNNDLCDGLQELSLPPCKPNQTHLPDKRSLTSKVLIPVVSTVTFIVILVSILFVCFVFKKSRKDNSTPSSTKELLPQISYLELNKSTNGFSMDNLIGSGSFGSVYKGVLPNGGSIVAVKVLNLQQQGASKSFIDECNTLSNIRHRNLLKNITSCSSIDVQGNEFKALVFNFMSKGNLDCWLHPANQGHDQRRLSLLQRLNIAIDIACGLDYLHNLCEIPIVHCDLKPSNILLDDDMVAHVGDFGLARYMLEGPNAPLSFSQTMSLALKGSIGYIPPEYGTGSRISIEGDVFSYGILLLEMLIGKRPTDDTFGHGVDIHLFATMELSRDALGIIDHSMLLVETDQKEEREDNIQEIATMSEEQHRKIIPRYVEECLVSMMRIGLSCSLRAPRERTPMNVIVNELQAIKSSYLKFKKTRQR